MHGLSTRSQCPEAWPKQEGFPFFLYTYIISLENTPMSLSNVESAQPLFLKIKTGDQKGQQQWAAFAGLL